ncbi:hypothetical protein H4R35_005170 [Dimargaris xerosporica]|nr:hypothetical protein H4R35_005170 [Dimargaris xerosporica]
MVKLKSIWLLAGPGEAMPDKLKVFINTEDVDFDTVDDRKCTQEWNLVAGQNEAVEYGTRITKFNNVRNLTLYFPSNFGADVTRIQYIGFTGEWTELREAPLVTLYELKPNVADHKVPGDEQRMHNNIF